MADCQRAIEYLIGYIKHSIEAIEVILDRDTEDPVLWLVRMEDDTAAWDASTYNRHVTTLDQSVELTDDDYSILANMIAWRDDLKLLSKNWDGSISSVEYAIADRSHWIFERLKDRIEGLEDNEDLLVDLMESC